MTKQKSISGIRRPDSNAMKTAQAERIGVDFRWHYGRITRLGSYDVLPSASSPKVRNVTILWEEGGLSCQHGDISDEHWDLLKLSFASTGMISILSDLPGEDWMYDLRFLEAVR